MNDEKKEITKLQDRIRLLENLIKDEIFRKESFGPLMRCSYCNVAQGNGHSVDCNIGLRLMGVRDI